uniref:Uncharacterized protein n=1 Tax=Scophthalmus maximus TaxID=52904 RepID=A0A8D3D1J5_SCOMX
MFSQFLSLLTLSVLHQTIFSFFFFGKKQQIAFILFIYFSKKEHGVDHRGKFYVKRAFIVYWEIPNLGTFIQL